MFEFSFPLFEGVFFFAASPAVTPFPRVLTSPFPSTVGTSSARYPTKGMRSLSQLVPTYQQSAVIINIYKVIRSLAMF